MLTQFSWAVHQRAESFVSHTGSLEAPEGTDFSSHTLHQDFQAFVGDHGMGAAPTASLGLLSPLSLQDRDSGAEPEGDKP